MNKKHLLLLSLITSFFVQQNASVITGPLKDLSEEEQNFLTSCGNGYHQIVKSMINLYTLNQNNVKEIKRLTNCHDAKGQTPLHYALLQKENISSPESDFITIIEMLLENYANPTTTDIDGNNALHHLFRNRLFYPHQKEVITSEIIKACRNHFDEPTVKMLINFQNKDGESPLHYLLQNEGPFSQNILQIIMENYADATLMNNQSKTAFDLLLENNQRTIQEKETAAALLIAATEEITIAADNDTFLSSMVSSINSFFALFN